ncbi:hypothetical protein TNCV_2834611 [Trichonephila clavipes]|nr:hypothetical protein TNCV_2834611 [Trichonephila clavipes]
MADNLTAILPDGHGYELVSSVRALVPQKFSVEEELMHVKHVEVKSPHVGVMWKFGRGVISSEIFLHYHRKKHLKLRNKIKLHPTLSAIEEVDETDQTPCNSSYLPLSNQPSNNIPCPAPTTNNSALITPRSIEPINPLTKTSLTILSSFQTS